MLKNHDAREGLIEGGDDAAFPRVRCLYINDGDVRLVSYRTVRVCVCVRYTYKIHAEAFREVGSGLSLRCTREKGSNVTGGSTREGGTSARLVAAERRGFVTSKNACRRPNAYTYTRTSYHILCNNNARDTSFKGPLVCHVPFRIYTHACKIYIIYLIKPIHVPRAVYDI